MEIINSEANIVVHCNTNKNNICIYEYNILDWNITLKWHTAVGNVG